MDFSLLRRDLNNLFLNPLGFEDPLSEFDELRRQALDVFDTHMPQLTDGGESEHKTKGGNKSGKEIVKKSGLSSIVPRRMVRWIPRCDAEETKDKFIIKAELPGIEKEKIHVDYDENVNALTISGERKNEREEKKENETGRYHFIERSSGQFSRTFKLPDACKTKVEEIKATSKDGVLEIVCPKEEEKEPEKKLKKIEIQ